MDQGSPGSRSLCRALPGPRASEKTHNYSSTPPPQKKTALMGWRPCLPLKSAPLGFLGMLSCAPAACQDLHSKSPQTPFKTENNFQMQESSQQGLSPHTCGKNSQQLYQLYVRDQGGRLDPHTIDEETKSWRGQPSTSP